MTARSTHTKIVDSTTLAVAPAALVALVLVAVFALAGYGTDWTFVAAATGATLVIGTLAAIADLDRPAPTIGRAAATDRRRREAAAARRAYRDARARHTATTCPSTDCPAHPW